MPSLWNWLSRGKHRITSSKKQEGTENVEERAKKKQHNNYRQRDKEGNKPKDLPYDLENSVVNHQSRFDMCTPKTEASDTVSNESRDKPRQEEGLMYDNAASKRRVPVYEIFGDNYKPVRKVTENTTQSQSSSGAENSPSYTQENRLLPYHVQGETIEFGDVEMRQKRPGIFGGLASKLHRHSLQAVLPGPGRDAIKSSEFRRSETVAGYVPRAVSLHDASIILSGGVNDDLLDSKYENTAVYDHSSKQFKVSPVFIPSSTHQHSQFARPGEHQQNGNRHLSKNIREVKNKDIKQKAVMSSNKSGQRISTDSHTKQSSTNDNFYFSSSMLDHIASIPRTITPSPFDESLESDDIAEEKNPISSVSTESSIPGYDKGNRFKGKNDTHTSSDTFWSNKTHPNNSYEFNTKINARDRTNNADEDNVNGYITAISYEHFEKVIDGSSNSNDIRQLFDTEGEVLY